MRTLMYEIWVDGKLQFQYRTIQDATKVAYELTILYETIAITIIKVERTTIKLNM